MDQMQSSGDAMYGDKALWPYLTQGLAKSRTIEQMWKGNQFTLAN
jgi:hypothetical protein